MSFLIGFVAGCVVTACWVVINAWRKSKVTVQSEAAPLIGSRIERSRARIKRKLDRQINESIVDDWDDEIYGRRS